MACLEAGEGAELLLNYWFKEPTLLCWLLSEPKDFTLTSLKLRKKLRSKVANIFLIYPQNKALS